MEKINKNIEKKEKPRIKAVFSDAGHILFDESGHRNAFLDYLEDVKSKGSGKSVPEIDVAEFKRVYAANKLRSYTEEGYDRRRAYRDTLDSIGVGNLYGPFMSWIEGRPKIGKSLNPHVKETVDALNRRGIDFIVLSDASSKGEELRAKLGEMGLNCGIKDVISSKDLGYCKPDPRFFDEALSRYGLKREEVVFVAHDLDELEGAHMQGIRTIALNYDPADLPSIQYSTRIRSFGDLLGIVEEESRKRED